jgi:predicted phosphodiesterase
MKALLVGDPHGTRAEMEDLLRLRAQVLDIEKRIGVDLTVYLGDLFDAFGLKDLEVERFWAETFAMHEKEVIALVGNHDRAGDSSLTAHSLQTLGRGGVYVVDRPMVVHGLSFIPFAFSTEQFYRYTQGIATTTKVLVCHQALSGARYDSGHPAEGPSAESVPHETIISGHLHTAQSFGKVWYPGSPRWRTVHDANKSKSLWVIDVAADGSIFHSQEFPSECRQLLHHIDLEHGQGVIGLLPSPDARYVIDIHGSKAFIEERRKAYSPYPNCRLRVFPTEARVSKVRESDGIEVAFRKYQETFKAPKGTPPEVLARMTKERFHG